MLMGRAGAQEVLKLVPTYFWVEPCPMVSFSGTWGFQIWCQPAGMQGQGLEGSGVSVYPQMGKTSPRVSGCRTLGANTQVSWSGA